MAQMYGSVDVVSDDSSASDSTKVIDKAAHLPFPLLSSHLLKLNHVLLPSITLLKHPQTGQSNGPPNTSLNGARAKAIYPTDRNVTTPKERFAVI